MRWTVLLSAFCLASAAEFTGCPLPAELQEEIEGYQNFVNEVTEQALKKRSGIFYKDLESFVDKFGNRLAGTKNLEDAIDFVLNKTQSSGLVAHKEPVTVPYWVRGEESAQLLSPRKKNLRILGLGSSPGTGESGITADVVVVSDFDQLKKIAKKVLGKIVLFNNVYTSYGDNVKYRSQGPAKASKLGAVAALIRSVTPFSIYSPHTGATEYGRQKKIPAAAVTLEDADLMARMYEAGEKVTVFLKMEGKTGPDQTSHNLIFDLRGSEWPNHYVTVSGHIDSWDVGQGALDDGGGAFLALHSILLLKDMKVPPPKRTLRGIMWTGEEEGLIGAYSYLKKHKDQLNNWSAAMESDLGLFRPLGLNFKGEHGAYCIMSKIMSLFKTLNATTVNLSNSVGSDIEVFAPSGVPLLDPLYDSNNYFYFHHTDGDSMRTMNSEDLDMNLALFSATSYILANLSIPLPRLG